MNINEILSVIQKWVENNYEVFEWIEAMLFLVFFFFVLYLLIFVLASLRRKTVNFEKSPFKNHFLVICAVLKDNESIFETINSIKRQNYSLSHINIAVAATNCTVNFKERLKALNVEILNIDDKRLNISETYKFVTQFFIDNNSHFDMIFILKPGNTLGRDVFERLNQAHYSGCSAVQLRRSSKGKMTSVQRVEALSEEMNNSIFRNGHSALGFSSALLDSGIAVDFELFSELMDEISDSRLEKQLEINILKRNIYIEYLPDVQIFDKKTSDLESYYSIRNSWINNKQFNLMNNILSLPKYLLSGHLDYCNKIVQWMLPSRIQLLMMLCAIAVLMFFINWWIGLRWFMLVGTLVLIFLMSLPGNLFDKRLSKAIMFLPYAYIAGYLKTKFAKKK